jgi:hypothetical protein
MARVKPFRLSRRSFIKGAGVAVCLPYLECMASTQSTMQRTTAPKRLCSLFVPNGVALPGLDSSNKQWHWFPEGHGKNFQFTQVLSSLTNHKNDLTVMSGLSHPKSRTLIGHAVSDVYLTGGDVGGEYLNTISLDQVAAEIKKVNTRYHSLVLSTKGGIGYKSRIATLSHDIRGNAIPAENRHREIFERYFSGNGQGTTEQRRASLARDKKVVDLIVGDSKRLQRSLGQNDKHKLEEYLTTLNTVEEQIKRNEAWLDIPMPKFNADHIDLAVDVKADPQAYVRTMLDLIVLAFQLDLTEVATYMLGAEGGSDISETFPQIALGFKKGHHKMTHDKNQDNWEKWGQYDQWLASHFGYFIGRLKDTQDEYGSLLDNTQVLYGSTSSTVHNARNYPLILAGGKNMGLKHGNYTQFTEKTPLSNLYLNMLNAAGVPMKSFADSNDYMDKMDSLFTL